MKRKEDNQYNMLLAVETHFDVNELLWTSNIPVADTKATFSDLLDQISSTIVLQRHTSTGVTSSKVTLRKDLEEKGFFVTSALAAYCSMHPDQGPEFKRLNITKSDFIRFRDTDLIADVDELYAATMTVIEGLGTYGITQATLTALMDANDAFREIRKMPEDITSNRKDATTAIPVLLHQAIALLDNTMDKLMNVFKATEPQFVNVYLIERKIHDTGARTLSLEILTLDADTNLPLEKADIAIVGEGIKRVSSNKGYNRVQNLTQGSHQLSVSRPGYAPQVIPFIVISGETTQLVVEMQSMLSTVTE